jgi:hypothetical protein
MLRVPVDVNVGSLRDWGRKVANAVNQLIAALAGYQPLDADLTSLASTGYVPLISYTVATLPSAAAPIRMIYVTDETGGAVPAFNDGTNWRRVTDRAVVS